MFTLTIPDTELFDEKTKTFTSIKGQTIQLEHSLVSISKWESKWHKPFLNDKIKKTHIEMLDYVRCMTLTQNVKPELYLAITPTMIKEIGDYINDPMTATTFSKSNKPLTHSNEGVTSELIYYWMIYYGIPDKFEKWHLNRLMTLIRICGIKNSPSKKMSAKESMSRMSALNKARRAATGSRG